MRTHAAKFIARIDAGHGGHDLGATYQDPDTGKLVLEKDVNLAVALQVPEYLPIYVRPTLSRTRDEFVDLRTRALPRGHHDLFVSIHANSLGDPERAKVVRGVEVIVYDLSDAWTVDVATRLATAVSEALGIPLNTNPIRENRKLRVLALSHEQSDRFGRSLSALRPATHPNAVGRGVGESGVGTPAFIVELGYLTSAEDRRALLTPGKRAAAARAIAEIIGGLEATEEPVEDDTSGKVEGFGAATDEHLRMVIDELTGAATEALTTTEEAAIRTDPESPRPLLKRTRKHRA